MLDVGWPENNHTTPPKRKLSGRDANATCWAAQHKREPRVRRTDICSEQQCEVGEKKGPSSWDSIARAGARTRTLAPSKRTVTTDLYISL